MMTNAVLTLSAIRKSKDSNIQNLHRAATDQLDKQFYIERRYSTELDCYRALDNENVNHTLRTEVIKKVKDSTFLKDALGTVCLPEDVDYDDITVSNDAVATYIVKRNKNAYSLFVIFNSSSLFNSYIIRLEEKMPMDFEIKTHDGVKLKPLTATYTCLYKQNGESARSIGKLDFSHDACRHISTLYHKNEDPSWSKGIYRLYMQTPAWDFDSDDDTYRASYIIPYLSDSQRHEISKTLQEIESIVNQTNIELKKMYSYHVEFVD